MQHSLALQEKWSDFPFLIQMANIGSEVSRAINWRTKNNPEYADLAFVRALELFDFTMSSKLTGPQLQETCRLRELWVDFFKYDNIYQSDEKFFMNYFNYLTVRAKT